MATYAQIVSILRSRLGKYMDEAELTNEHYESCIAWGVRQSDGTTADPSQVTEAEVGAITDVDKLVDYAELCLIKAIIGGLPYVDVTTGPISEKLSQLTKHMFMLKENKEKQMKAEYGYGLGTLTPGIITSRFEEPYS